MEVFLIHTHWVTSSFD